MTREDRHAEVYGRLALVLDPELDQPLTELGFVHEIEVHESDVTVSFRLPTYWCAPNFAFLMASDIKQRVAELPWVKNVHVRLVDHSESDAINQGIEHGRSFTETFPELSNGELESLRFHFRRKAFLVRQERLYRHLRAAGKSDHDIATMTVSDLRALPDPTSAPLVERYLEVLTEIFQTCGPHDKGFVDLSGTPIPAEGMPVHMKFARNARVNQEVNAVYCRGLLRTRYQGEDPAMEEMHV
ncbi:iron-sulfur cluster assembly protein [Alicyclobacillus macrosporangiidus]|uniref:iron-sulfur cluster assembly protein n=1 Tax=Alicyclobacillus macrosporangiidus TaxID=392015 RepID=UPI000689FAEE|nr:iron-sulfur cluster assembly protein [Alicyclobacillus macrosporangiidus]